MVYCAVYGCKSSNKSCEKIVFHRFPNNTAEAAKWLQFCKRADTVNLKNAAICGMHFKPTDYRRNLRHEVLNPGQPESRPKLKRGAVPSVEVPKCNTDAENYLRIRKKYLHGDAFNVQLQQDEDRRCRECGSYFECMSPLISPGMMRNIKLENKEYNKVLPALKLEVLDGHLQKDGICNIFPEEDESLSDIISHDYAPVCLVCDTVIKDSAAVGIPDLFLESSVTSHTHQQLVVMLAVLINTPLNSEKAYSRSLCQRCFKLIDELDEAQHRTAAIKSDIEGLYNQSLQKRNLMLKNSAIDEELQAENPGTSVHDHQYIKHSEMGEKDVQPLLYLDNLETKEHSFGPFDRNQWRKDEVVSDAVRREKDPSYRETVRKGWRERKAKQRMKECDNVVKQTVLKNDEHTLMAVEEVLSSFASNQAEPEMHSVIQVTHSTGPSNPIVDAKEVQMSYPKPITIKVFKTNSLMSPAMSELQLPQEKLKNRVKRSYRKRTNIVHLCKFCMKVFSTGEELKKHQKTHTTIECKFCGKILVRIGAWENHLRTFHNVEIHSSGDNTEEIFSCDKCNKQFTSKSALKYHVKLHDGKIYTCEKCDKEFNHPGTFKNHKLIHEDRKFICDKCGKGFRTNFHLIMHDNQTHRKARSWKCKYCEKAFARCATFREHMRSHNTGKVGIPSLLQVDASHTFDVSKDDTQLDHFQSESLNENGDLLFTEGCKMLSIGEEVVSEETRIVLDENESTCEEQNLVVNSEAELYGGEFVISDDGNLIIGSLMDVK